MGWLTVAALFLIWAWFERWLRTGELVEATAMERWVQRGDYGRGYQARVRGFLTITSSPARSP